MKIEEDPVYKAIIMFIHGRRRAYPNEIAEIFKFSRQAADYRLKRLLEHGYIKRMLDDDGRVYYILNEKGYKILEAEEKRVSKEEIYSVIRFIPLLPFAMGLIGLGKYIAEADFIRGMISFIMWIIVSIIVYVLIITIFKK
ncbi:MAG TPA: hypothetical protein ENF47_01920 [Thermoprotei archaeon]|mgnify:CR=1 FL=1|nr:hypothetical protein [Thermoprotei archaeon]